MISVVRRPVSVAAQRHRTGETVLVGSTAAAPEVNSPLPKGRRVITPKVRLLLLLPALDLIVVVGGFVSLGDFDSYWLGLLAYNLLSPVALAVLVVLTAGLWPRGMPVTAVTCVLFSGILVAALLNTGSSSTGVLLLLFLPIWYCIALVPFAGLGVLVHWLRGRKATFETI